jgi:hypothetical protein
MAILTIAYSNQKSGPMPNDSVQEKWQKLLQIKKKIVTYGKRLKNFWSLSVGQLMI